MPELDVVLAHEPPLFVDLEEAIFHNQPALRHRVFIDIVEIEDWHTPSISSASGGSDSGSEGDDFLHPYFSHPWPKRIRFADGGSGQDDGDGPADGGTSHQVVQDIIDDDVQEDGGFLVNSVRIPWKQAAVAGAGGDGVNPSRGGGREALCPVASSSHVVAHV
jgi:hypothetical protein